MLFYSYQVEDEHRVEIMYRLEYECVGQSECEEYDRDLTGNAKPHSKLTGVLSHHPVSGVLRLFAKPLLFFAAAGILLLVGKLRGDWPQQHQQYQEATPELIESRHGKIPSNFFNPLSPNEVTCADHVRTQSFQCISDRLGNGEALAGGTVLCSQGGRYAFGMDESGSLFWSDCRDDIERIYFQCDSDCYFVLTEDATFLLRDGSATAAGTPARYEKQCKVDIGHAEEACLDDPRYDCPYLHLHSSGKLVLHYVNDKGETKQKNTDKIYSFDMY